ncbi:MAG: L,D-transpeptidase [Oceanococcaceae bacterium]
MARVEISLARQRLCLWQGDVARDYPISTAAMGAGERENSGCTPRGRHRIAEKIGADAPVGSVFVGRVPTGEIFTEALGAEHPERDWILTRILWLAGCEPGTNAGPGIDTYARYIYIHGTNDIESLGQPVSHGCIRMNSADVMAVFDRVSVGDEVMIHDD